MAQIFHRSTNFISRLSLLAVLFLGVVALFGLFLTARSSYMTGQFISQPQPVQFSHKHHVGDDGIDCRYCHTSVETSAYAGIPPTKICMNCHSVLFSASAYLEPVRESYRSDKSIEWVKVHHLPDFVYFNHSIHVNKGVGCSTCHGKVNQMPLIWNVASLHMEWCLECHRDPAKRIRPREQVVNMDWPPRGYDQTSEGKKLMKQYNIKSAEAITNCSTCHR